VLLEPDLVTLGDLTFKLLATDLPTLSEGDVKWLRSNHLVVHFRDGLGSFIRGGKTDETEPFGAALLVSHDLAARDSAKRFELSAELVIIDIVLKVFDVEVDSLILAQLLHLGLIE
jgi:hypothetical protein